jgi:hypothetical protein
LGISTWGWGSCGGVITTWGWGPVCVEYIPVLIATYLANSSAYSCVVTRKYIEIKTRDKGDILLRVRPDAIPERVREQVLIRARGDVLVRSAGWPRESGELCD